MSFDADPNHAELGAIVAAHHIAESAIASTPETKPVNRQVLERCATLAEGIDLSPCNGGSCMVATQADEQLDQLRAMLADELTRTK